jgi:GntR family transcriptional regulator
MAASVNTRALAREPLYLQVCELLTQQIARGIWKPNATLPNETELARELGVSAGTVRKALEKLEADRLVMRRQGRGTFVVDQEAPEVTSRFCRIRQKDGEPIAYHAKLLRQSSGEPTSVEQNALQIGPDEPVARKRRLLSVHTRAFMVEDACLAVSRLPGLRAEEAGDWNPTALAQRHGVHVARAREELRLLEASHELAALLSVEPGTMLMQLDRIISSLDDTPIEWRSASCHLHNEYYLAEVN